MKGFKNSVKSMTAIIAGILLSGCEFEGGIPTTYETVPASATLLAQGTFIGSDEVSGTAQVYSNRGVILLHLEGLVTPSATLYYVFLENGPPAAPFYSSVLRAPQGNQNYNTGRRNSGVFSRVSLRVNGSPLSTEVASAALIQTLPYSMGLGAGL